MDKLLLTVDEFWISPYAMSAFVALEEKQLPFETKVISLPKKEHLTQQYQTDSLTGRVPALQHGKFWLSESSAISEYLEEAFPPPKTPALFPANIQERARARQLMAWIRSDLMPIREERSTVTVFYQPSDKPLSPAGEAAAKRLLAAAEALILPGQKSLFGRFSIADVDLALMLQRLILSGHPVPQEIKDFVEAQWQRPSVQKWVTKARPPYVPY